MWFDPEDAYGPFGPEIRRYLAPEIPDHPDDEDWDAPGEDQEWFPQHNDYKLAA